MNCSGASLTSLPSSIQQHTNVLDLRDNTITDLCTVHAYMQNLTQLHLQSNHIRTVCINFLGEMAVHKGLLINIQNNEVTTLPQEIRKLKTVQWMLSGNPFLCDCDTLWMRDWVKNTIITVQEDDAFINQSEVHIKQIRKREATCDYNKQQGQDSVPFPNSIVMDYPHVTCHNGQFAGQSIYSMRAGQLGCLPLPEEAIIILSCISAIVLIVLCLALVAFKRWNEIRWILYNKANRFIARGDKHEDLDNIVFDALISYR